MRKIDAVHIFAHGVFRDGNAFQHIAVFHNDGHRFFVDVIGNRSCHILLVTVGAHRIADIDDFQQFFFCITLSGDETFAVVRIGVFTDGITVRSGQIFDHFIRRGGFHGIVQLIDGIHAVYVRQKTQSRRIFHRKLKMIVLIQNNIEIIGNFVPVFFDNPDQIVDCFIQSLIFGTARFVHVFNRHIVGQFIVSQKFAVAVINIPPRAGNIALFSYLEFKIVHIFRAVHNLERKNPMQKRPAKHTETYDKNKQSRCNQAEKPLFQIIKQIFSHSFSHAPQASGQSAESADTGSEKFLLYIQPPES